MLWYYCQLPDWSGVTMFWDTLGFTHKSTIRCRVWGILKHGSFTSSYVARSDSAALWHHFGLLISSMLSYWAVTVNGAIDARLFSKTGKPEVSTCKMTLTKVHWVFCAETIATCVSSDHTKVHWDRRFKLSPLCHFSDMVQGRYYLPHWEKCNLSATEHMQLSEVILGKKSCMAGNV